MLVSNRPTKGNFSNIGQNVPNILTNRILIKQRFELTFVQNEWFYMF